MTLTRICFGTVLGMLWGVFGVYWNCFGQVSGMCWEGVADFLGDVLELCLNIILYVHVIVPHPKHVNIITIFSY